MSDTRICRQIEVRSETPEERLQRTQQLWIESRDRRILWLLVAVAIVLAWFFRYDISFPLVLDRWTGIVTPWQR